LRNAYLFYNFLSGEFYLIAQSTNQGTVSPTHFHVISSDDDSLPLERLQIYTNLLTHLYFNWPVKFFLIYLIFIMYTEKSEQPDFGPATNFENKVIFGDF